LSIFLVQPPDSPAPARVLDATRGDSVVFSPAWDLLCLKAFLDGRTRHTAHIVDCRLMGDLPADLPARIAELGGGGVLAVRTTTPGLGEAMAVVEITKRAFPGMTVVLFGQHPTQFPAFAGRAPHVDFALCGDPEPILRNLLDNLDVESRLRKTPGLVCRGDERCAPYWLGDLRGLSLPEWAEVFWPAYQEPTPRRGSRAEARLSRGHTGREADRASGSADEPLRAWPEERMAACLQKCRAAGVVEVCFADPPGFWTDERLRAWCLALERERNTQPWSFRTLPRDWSGDLLDRLHDAACRRIEILLPSCDPDLLGRYGCAPDLRRAGESARRVHEAGIECQTRFWIGGPEEREGEADRAVRALKMTGFQAFSMQPFPFSVDTPLYAALAREARAPGVEAWIAWAQDPWMEERPVALWGGEPARASLDRVYRAVQRTLLRNPGRLVRRIVSRILTAAWLEDLEARALNVFLRPPSPKA
jgi:hypothetical protein